MYINWSLVIEELIEYARLAKTVQTATMEALNASHARCVLSVPGTTAADEAIQLSARR